MPCQGALSPLDFKFDPAPGLSLKDHVDPL